MLLRHMRLHTKETPYKCDFCDRAFSTQEQRRRHEDSHTGRRGYFCAVCNKCFVRTCERTRCERAHKGVVFSCADCDNVYKDAGTLRHHRFSRHPDQYQKQRANAYNEEGIIATAIQDIGVCKGKIGLVSRTFKDEIFVLGKWFGSIKILQ